MNNLKPGDKVVVKFTEVINKIMTVSKGKFIEVDVLDLHPNFPEEVTVRYPGFIKFIPKSDIVYKVNKPSDDICWSTKEEIDRLMNHD